MSKKEAYELLDYILLERKPGAADVRQIGNGDFVVILKNLCYFLWSFADWIVFRQREERKYAKTEVKL